MNPKLLLCLLFFLFVFQNGHSQTTKTKAVDSTKVMYQKIEKYSNKSNFRKFLHKLIFSSTQRSKPSNNNLREKIDEKIGKSEGKIIRNIDIVSLDPFGYSTKMKIENLTIHLKYLAIKFTSNLKNGRLEIIYFSKKTSL